MVPTFLLFGLLVSIVPRGWVLVVLPAVAFATYLPAGDRFSDSGNALGFSLLGGLVLLVNAGVGLGIGHSMKWAITR